MSCIVYQTDRTTGVKYAYESISYWDKDKQQPRSKRKYIGKVDPETGEIIQKKARGSHSADVSGKSDDVIDKLKEEIKQKDSEIQALKGRIKEQDADYKNLLKIIHKATSVLTLVPEEG